MRFFVLILLSSGSFANPRERRQTVETSTGFWWENLESNSGQSLAQPVAVPDKISDNVSNNRKENAGSVFLSQIESSSEARTNFSTDSLVRYVECGEVGSACVPYYLCKDGFIVTDGAGLFDIRVGSNTIQRNSKCMRFLEVCCAEPENTPVEVPPIQISTECGRRNIEGIHANIPGLNVTQTQFAEYPWMVALLRVESIGAKDVNLYICGGSLIYPNVVLTAAHCVKAHDEQHFKVRAGEWDTQSDYELYPHQDRLVAKVIVHPQFHPQSLVYDFALLILESPFILAPNINTVCLPNQDEVFKDVTCFATGWGKDKYGIDGQYQNILKQVPLGVVSTPQCVKLLRNTRLGKYYLLHESFVCAGGKKGVDTCKGDGGSPLVCSRPSPSPKLQTYFQVGIVAWGIGCGENGVPGVYADVTKGIDWIYSVVEPFLKV